jgi:hypothetical protein
MRIIKILILLLALVQLIGCQKANTTALDSSLLEYNQSQWLISEMWAKKSIESGKNTHEAQYMMGLCEFQLQNIDNSTAWFTKASASSDPEVKGKATAMLGIIASSKGDYQEAARAFNTSSNYLLGSDKIQAESRSGKHVKSNNFTLQFGAFQKKVNATKAIDTLSNSINKAGLGRAWITEETNRSGRILFLVQAGHFKSRNAASLIREQYKLPQCIVTATP